MSNALRHFPLPVAWKSCWKLTAKFNRQTPIKPICSSIPTTFPMTNVGLGSPAAGRDADRKLTVKLAKSSRAGDLYTVWEASEWAVQRGAPPSWFVCSRQLCQLIMEAQTYREAISHAGAPTKGSSLPPPPPSTTQTNTGPAARQLSLSLSLPLSLLSCLNWLKTRLKVLTANSLASHANITSAWSLGQI